MSDEAAIKVSENIAAAVSIVAICVCFAVLGWATAKYGFKD